MQSRHANIDIYIRGKLLQVINLSLLFYRQKKYLFFDKIFLKLH